MVEKEATLDELQQALAQSLAQMRELRQTLSDGIGPPKADFPQTVGLPGALPLPESQSATLLGDSTSSTAVSFATTTHAEAAPTTTAHSPSGEHIASSETTLVKSNPFFEFISERLDPLFSCGDSRKPHRGCGDLCSGRRSKVAPQ